MQGLPIGVLLVNTGTPDSPSVSDVRRYLRQFLMDPRVIDVPAVPRWMLVNLLIAPFRAPKSASAYKKVWTPAGSPLMVKSTELKVALQEELGTGYRVELGMVVGNPSVATGLERLRDCTEIRIVPLFPQYAGATVGSVLDACFSALRSRTNPPPVQVIPPFYADPSFLDSVATLARPILKEFRADQLIYSLHGLPETQVLKAGEAEGRTCLTEDCCTRPSSFCYRNHCLATVRGLQERLGPGVVAFQSRLGRAKWLEPSLEDVIVQLAKDGCRRLAVVTPGFLADCLETIEEIGERGAALFRENGGEAFCLVPALNAHAVWVRALGGMVRGAR